MNEHNDHGEWCVCIDCMVSVDSKDRPDGFLKWQEGAPWNQITEREHHGKQNNRSETD